ncbi:MAG: cation:proton antiporter [Kangiellaceae bacterium]|jgi:CPA2 family monovalent cation:H+ antiporter-2|nr:cation:proton antiporter [Kangiellaceae bacterium]
MQHIIYAQLLITLAFSVLLVALFRRVNAPTILAYLILGLIMGQVGFEFFEPNTNAHIVAEIGVVFMLFTLGLEFSLPKVIAMKKPVLVLGGLQVIIGLIVFTLMVAPFVDSIDIAIIIAAALTMSSTAIVTKQLSEQNDINKRHGVLSVATLLFQDMAAIPLLILVPIIASNNSDAIGSALSFSLLKGVLAFAVILAIGKWLLPKLFGEIASVHSDELFVMTCLTVALSAAWFTHWLGLSMALGAFLTGMLLAESQFKHQIETEIRPFRDILLGLFFITIGTLIDLTMLITHAPIILLCLSGFIILKLMMVVLAAKACQESLSSSVKTAFILSHAGELGFVILGIARQQNILTETQASLALSIGVLSMMCSPLLIRYAEPLTKRMFSNKVDIDLSLSSQNKIASATQTISNHVILCGFGRNGQTLKRFFDRLDIPCVVLDLDARRVQEASTAGEAIYYGDATRKQILLAAGIEKARQLVVTFDSKKSTLDLLAITKQFFPHVPVMVRTKDERDMEILLQAGANQVIPESLESTLMLVSQVLYTLGLPIKRIIAETQRVRDDRYHSMQSFYHGDKSDLLRVLETHHEQLHAVVLTDFAKAAGLPLREVKLPEKAYIESIKRGKESYTPPDRNLSLKPGDIILLSGEPDAIAQAESVLLDG